MQASGLSQPTRARALRVIAWIVTASGTLSGCSAEDSTAGAIAVNPGAQTPGDGCDAIDLAAPGAEEGVQLAIELQLMPGQERQVCKLVRLERAINLNWSEGIYTQGSHHGLTARTSYRGALPTQNIRGETVDAGATADCESIGSDWDMQGVVAGGHAVGASPSAVPVPTMKGLLPDDVALKIAANEVLELNFHLINATDRPLQACYKQNLYGIPDTQVRVEAGTMFYYNSFITVPAKSTASTTMACPISHDVTLAGQVSHMHRRGVGYAASLLDADPLAGGKELQRLYEGSAWDEPLVRIDSPLLSLSAGQWIRWTCDYQNPENRDVAQGQQTTDEMCMFLGTYWPRSDGMDLCNTPGSGDTEPASRLLANGTMNGAEFLDCWRHSPQVIDGGGPESAADRFASQRCFTESCAKVSGRVNEFGPLLDPNTVTCD